MSRPFSARWPNAPLRALLVARAISHEDLADKLDVSVRALRRAVAGDRLTTEQATRICDAVGTVPAAVWPDWNVEHGVRAWEPMPWADRGRCRGAPELFFASPNERHGDTTAREQLAISEYCDVCPVRRDCRDYARRNRELGVWGGETELERALAGYGPPLTDRRDVAQAKRIAHTYGGQEQ